jgi:hypothetical protein
MKRLLLLGVFLLICSCATTRPPVVQEQMPSLVKRLLACDSLSWLKGYGNLQLGVHGQKVKLSIETVWNGDSDCTINLYMLFGTVATLSTDSTGRITVHAMKREIVKEPDDTLDIGMKMVSYPFTCRDVMHILMGRLLNTSFVNQEPDSSVMVEDTAHLLWLNPMHTGGNYTVDVEINRKQSRITKVSFCASGNKGWQLDYTAFNDTLPQEIQFKDANNNYFNLYYDKLTCGVERRHEER